MVENSTFEKPPLLAVFLTVAVITPFVAVINCSKAVITYPIAVITTMETVITNL